MPDPQTPNLQLYIPARGADPGTWDVPANANMSALDAALGQTSTVAITNVNITLSAAQYQCGTIVFTGTQTGDVIITFPAFGRMYNVFNNCVNNNTWLIRLVVAAGVVCAPPGELTTVYTDGVNFFYLGMGMVGTYLPYAGSAVPRWITSCTQPPFLNCDGSAFSAVTYPALNAILGSAVTPDLKGRAFYNMNQGTARLSAIDGNTLFANGGSNALTILQTHLPSYNLAVTDPTHHHFTISGGAAVGSYGGAAGAVTGGDFSADVASPVTSTITGNVGTGISVNLSGGGTAYTYISPSIVGGITMIRAG